MTDSGFRGHNKGMQRLFIIASLGVLGISFYWPRFYTTFKQSNVLATVISSKGTTEWITRQSLSKRPLQKSLSIKMNESLATGSDGEMVLRFKRGAEIRLLPSSFVTVVRKANSTLLALRRGEIEVINEGEGDSVLVSQKGLDRPLREYESPTTLETLWIDPQSLDTVKIVETSAQVASAIEGSNSEINPNSPITLSKDPLAPISEKQSQDFQSQIRSMIADRISRQKNHLFRCYSTLIQKKKAAHGKLDLHFTVNNIGKVEDLMIVKTEIQDKKFEGCLLQIIKRTDFQPFQGQKVSTFLPLRFEKNLNPTE